MKDILLRLIRAPGKRYAIRLLERAQAREAVLKSLHLHVDAMIHETETSELRAELHRAWERTQRCLDNVKINYADVPETVDELPGKQIDAQCLLNETIAELQVILNASHGTSGIMFRRKISALIQSTKSKMERPK